jgi:Uso1 / p115 like vesicle tethering protein, C terminal region
MQSESLLSEKEEQRAAVQNELDDLLMVLGDLEEKAKKYKVRLRKISALHNPAQFHRSESTSNCSNC